jgi:hypothetical protein
MVWEPIFERAVSEIICTCICKEALEILTWIVRMMGGLSLVISNGWELESVDFLFDWEGPD